MASMIRILIFTVFLLSVSLDSAAAFRLGEKGPKVGGFFEFAFGLKLGEDDTRHDEFNMLEQRLQLKTSIYPEFSNLLKDWGAEFNFKGDFTIDEYFAAKTGFELRECDLLLSPLSWLDLKLGRQVFTWGTGDYLFVNDLFPKDYVSFYIGREDEYLKKPSDGVKSSFYFRKFNLDFVVIPRFEPNTIFKGERLSFFDSFTGGIAGRNSDRQLSEPGSALKNTEYASRLYRNFGSYEGALYFFRGFYKMPRGYLNEAARELFYPRLDSYGGSLRGPALSGIVNFEFAYYNSRQDDKGDNRLIENSMFKCLVGYDRDLGNDLRLGVQYLYEQILDYDNYRTALLPADFRWDEERHLITLRLLKLFKNQTVTTNLFTFFSPSDMDVYLRPSLSYKASDDWLLSFGANFVWGRDGLTEFGQMEKNKNMYFRARYNF